MSSTIWSNQQLPAAKAFFAHVGDQMACLAAAIITGSHLAKADHARDATLMIFSDILHGAT